MKPIHPDDVKQVQADRIPPEVIQVFNELIVENYTGYAARFTFDDAVERISEVMGMSRQQVFAHKLLDVEAIFEAIGWKVETDMPAYNESYKSTFKFTKK